MPDFNAKRKNMIDCQISTAGVIDPVVLEAFGTVERHRFVPESLQSVAYSDEDLLFGDGEFLLDPMTHARMVEALKIQPDDIALDVGSGTGYSSAILSFSATTVIALEDRPDVLEKATALWEELGHVNIAGFVVDLTVGSPDHAPFDAIFINGSVERVPEKLLRQLSPGGRLIAIVKEAGEVMGHVTVFEKSAGGSVSSRVLFEAGCPYLQGFEPRPAFVF